MIQRTSATINTALAQAAQKACAPLKIVGGLSPGDAPCPISFGAPLSRGFATDQQRWTIADNDGTCVKVQAKALAHWPDGSIKWLHGVTMKSSGESKAASYSLSPCSRFDLSDANDEALLVRENDDSMFIRTGVAGFKLPKCGETLIARVANGKQEWLGDSGCRLVCMDAKGRRHVAQCGEVRVVEEGPIRATIAFRGELGRRTKIRFTGNLCFYVGSGLVRLEITAQNPQRARHQGGFWDLGDPGSILLQDLAIELESSAPESSHTHWLEQPDATSQTTSSDTFEIYQDSSGGENWHSRNHLNRQGRIPLRFRGYRVQDGGRESQGRRASPVVALAWEGAHVSCALTDFWQQFPSAIETRGNRLIVRLLPGQFDDLHELQGGEHNSRVVWLNFGKHSSDPCQQLAWVHDPPNVVVDSAWIAASGAVPFFPFPQSSDRNEFHSILQDSLEGEHNFFAKRERIDEYGWRHYGDLWADHEEAFGDDSPPVISHYNNQYDLLHSLLIQSMRCGDARWLRLAAPLARHIMDIDIYHTDRDKPAYNGGLFWHTAHYHDAGQCSHRSMSNAMCGKRIPVSGGGPGNEHNYASGLLLYHFLTGCERARQTVIGLADWVIAMDDGRRHVLGVISDAPTGDASRTAEADYHGPGRGAGNSIFVLLDGWQAGGGEKYLEKAIELIYRTIHPHDDIAARDLGNAELRWSYTVHLQALLRFLDLTSHRDDLAAVRRYARDCVTHYARWMAEHERFYLDAPEQLEYPTETWAAQELRKGVTLLMAACYVDETEGVQLRTRGESILQQAWQSLLSFETRRYTRPLALALQQGYLETFLTTGQTKKPHFDPIRGNESTRPPPQSFEDQKQHFRQLRSSPKKLLGSLKSAFKPSRWRNVARQSWLRERLRQQIGF